MRHIERLQRHIERFGIGFLIVASFFILTAPGAITQHLTALIPATIIAVVVLSYFVGHLVIG